mmetsp:Transcript_5285/g.11807  ORF Transcript_5285/g.11807 Transcript_5285/m.11807 type:complete len:83 (-) Transcript_5285:450-698(-)
MLSTLVLKFRLPRPFGAVLLCMYAVFTIMGILAYTQQWVVRVAAAVELHASRWQGGRADLLRYGGSQIVLLICRIHPFPFFH